MQQKRKRLSIQMQLIPMRDSLSVSIRDRELESCSGYLAVNDRSFECQAFETLHLHRLELLFRILDIVLGRAVEEEKRLESDAVQ